MYKLRIGWMLNLAFKKNVQSGMGKWFWENCTASVEWLRKGKEIK